MGGLFYGGRNVVELTAQKKVVLGAQHTVAMFGATILVPLLTGLDPAVALLSAGLGTLIFHLLTKRMVPVFLGSSFAFIPPIIAARDGGYSWAAVGAGIVGAGVIYALMSLTVTFVGSARVRRLFPPIVTGPVIAVIGITLAPTAVGMASGQWWLAIATLGGTIVAAVWFRGLFKMLPILTGLVFGYVVAIFAGAVDFTPFKEAAWIGLPNFTWAWQDVQWGAIALIAPVAFVTMIEHVGDILTNGGVVGKDFFKQPGLHRTLIGDGVATLLAGFIGGPANTTYSENTGVLAVTGVYDPAILRIGAGFAIVLGFIPKLAAILQTVPVAVLGGLSIILFGMIASIGMRTLADAQVDFTHSRNLIVVALILVLGLGVTGLEHGIVWFGVQVSGLALAALVGVVANLVLPKEMDVPERV
ncbi:MAG: uracil permease [Gammaproteobacteria bacterium]|nr:uracil permease [Gammaproteobacteria bacterium]